MLLAFQAVVFHVRAHLLKPFGEGIALRDGHDIVLDAVEDQEGRRARLDAMQRARILEERLVAFEGNRHELIQEPPTHLVVLLARAGEVGEAAHVDYSLDGLERASVHRSQHRSKVAARTDSPCAEPVASDAKATGVDSKVVDARPNVVDGGGSGVKGCEAIGGTRRSKAVLGEPLGFRAHIGPVSADPATPVNAHHDGGGGVLVRAEQVNVQWDPVGARVNLVEKDLHGSEL